jgi:hypothetical protein
MDAPHHFAFTFAKNIMKVNNLKHYTILPLKFKKRQMKNVPCRSWLRGKNPGGFDDWEKPACSFSTPGKFLPLFHESLQVGIEMLKIGVELKKIR